MAPLRILLADDHTVVRQGLRKVLEEWPDWKVVAEAGDGREAVRQAEQLEPDVAILDIARLMLDDYVKQRSGEPGIIDRYETLSDREREVFQLIAEGKTNKDIAA